MMKKMLTIYDRFTFVTGGFFKVELATLVVTEPEFNWKISYYFEDDFNDEKDVDNL